MLCCFLCCLKQKWSVCLLTAYSHLLFLAGAFVIYISICLNNGSKPFSSETDDDSQLSLDSYLVIFSIITGCLGILLALFGCCTARTKDKCTVGFFSICGLILFAYFLITGTLLIILHSNEETFIDKFCSEDESLRSKTEDLNVIEELAFDFQDVAFNETRRQIREIDQQLNKGMQQYMCKNECPCDARGKLDHIQLKWPEKIRKDLKQYGTYNFNGDITNYYQCYQKLVLEEKVTKVDQQLLIMIQDFEKSLKCVGFCYTPNFWFFEDFFEGPPQQNCLKSMRDKFNNTDGYLGYSLMAMAVFSLFQLFSICGICRSTDKSFQEDREANQGREAVYLNEEKDQFRAEVGDNSSNGKSLGKNYQTVEMPERAQRFQIRQRNYEID